MGYWTTNPEGHSFTDNEGGPEMIWGDRPADIIDDALQDIIAAFNEDVGRPPTMEELIAGIQFSARVALEDANKDKGPIERRLEAVGPGYIERLEQEANGGQSQD